jgi:hypothetical protein
VADEALEVYKRLIRVWSLLGDTVSARRLRAGM